MAQTLAESASFKAEDFSRFLIREFLKMNKMDKTYDMFMQEDTRPKVVMSKNKLTAFLGLDYLVKQNAKTKTYQTMLDIISNYLAEVKEVDGGVKAPTKGSYEAAKASAEPTE